MTAVPSKTGVLGGERSLFSRSGSAVLPFLMLLVGMLLSTAPAGAQTGTRGEEEVRRRAEQRLGRSVSHAEIIEQLRQSGMNRAEVRSRLQQLGYDPSLADRYFDAVEKGGEPPRGEAPDSLLETLRRIGVSARSGSDRIPFPNDTIPFDTLALDSIPPDTLAPGELPIFGREVFRRSSNQFQPIVTGPVDPGYRLGPGDEIGLVLTGDVEDAYFLEVTREGFIVIPNVGQVVVNGLTLGEVEDLLYRRLGNVYSGIGSTADFQLSLGRLRRNQVFLVGEVERPGAYQVNAMSTVFNALYQARGPNKNGSFRRIEVRRRGQVVRVVDVYDYLLNGDSRDDIRLEQGDVIFVPVVGAQVGIQGAVRRSALYELKEGEGLRDVLRFAGRMDAQALLTRVQIDRIVPAAERRDGVDRVLVDVDVRTALADGASQVALRDGDMIQVFRVSTERRNRVTLAGGVRRPGVYEWAPGMTLEQVLQRGEGLAEPAYTARAHIYRLNPEDGSRSLIQAPLTADGTGVVQSAVPLADLDSVVVYSRADLSNPQLVAIDGFVKNPGTYPLAEGMSVPDLILMAGGFIHGANAMEADVARLPDPLQRTDTTAYLVHVPLVGFAGQADGDPAGGARAASLASAVPDWLPSASEFRLQHGDRVFIRRAPGYEPVRPIRVTGEVLRPGTYILQVRQERLLGVLERAGGLTREAYPPGLQVIRGGKLVATDLERAMRDPNSRYNLVLEPEDSVYIPKFDPTILVTGAVAFESRVLYQPGEGLDYYINRAGGYVDGADKGRVSITYKDGERATVDRALVLFRRTPNPQPGSTIFVPPTPEAREGFNWDSFLSRTLSIVSTTVTLLVAINQIR